MRPLSLEVTPSGERLKIPGHNVILIHQKTVKLVEATPSGERLKILHLKPTGKNIERAVIH
jgi:hypothetical protein